jgi:selenocysteine-specific elongation factor
MQVIGTAGHVDHGKSTLVERLTGIDPDRFAEEKRRGLTIDLGFAWLRLPSGREIGVVDVPGHERFIKNMLAGTGGISVCLFVVAANEGWMPQSSEHLAILDLLDVTWGVVALTKIDTVDDETVEIARAEVEEHLAPTTLAAAPIVACSALTGEGLDVLVKELDRIVSSAPPVPDLGRPRLWVDRVFTIAGAGTVVTGTLGGGSLGVGDEIELAPEGRRARIRAVQTHKKAVERVPPGNRAALNLAGLHRQGARRGDAVVQPRRWRPTARVDATVRVLSSDLSGAQRGLTEKGAHLLYVGSAETPVRLKLLADDVIAPGGSGDPLPLARGDRFVLRDAGRVLTFGGGVVVDPLASPARRGDAARVGLIEKLSRASDEEGLTALLASQGSLDAAEAMIRSGVRRVPSGVRRLGKTLFSPERVAEVTQGVLDALTQHHLRHPLERGMMREALRSRTGLEGPEFDDLVRAIDVVVEEGPTLRLGTHSVTLDPRQRRAQQELLEVIDGGGFAPPVAADLRADPALLRSLTDAGELVRIGDFYLTSKRAAEARRTVRDAIAQRGPLTVAEIRNLLGTSRKYAVPLCEWLDSTGATRRQGDLRSLGPVP